MQKIKKSIIIPSLKHLSDLLRPCLEGIIKYTDLTDVEVVVVLNGCGNDGSREYVESLGEHFKVVWIEEPAGYTRATNEGVKVSKGEIVILMNNDVVLLPQEKNTWINYLCNPLRDNIGLTCNLKLWDWSVERFFGLFFLAATPRWLWNRVGGLDETTWSPGGGEDIEYCLQIEQLGFKILQVPDDKLCEQKDGLNVNRFPSYHPGEATVMDEEHREKWVKHIADIRAKLEYKYKLPKGSFNPEDVREYRRLVEDIPEGGTMCELGCAHGRSLCSVADIIKRKKLKVTVVDTFNGTENEVGWDHGYRPEFEGNIERFGIKDNVTILQGYTTEVCKEVEDNQFDLIFLDCDHTYEAVKKDMECWVPKAKIHGTFSFHDYNNHCDNPVFGVSIAVNEKFPVVRVADTSCVVNGWYGWGSVCSVRL